MRIKKRDMRIAKEYFNMLNDYDPFGMLDVIDACGGKAKMMTQWIADAYADPTDFYLNQIISQDYFGYLDTDYRERIDVARTFHNVWAWLNELRIEKRGEF